MQSINQGWNNRIAVVATAEADGYAAVEDVTLHSLFPDIRRSKQHTQIIDRIGTIHLHRKDGKISGRCSRWWDLATIDAQLQQCPDKFAPDTERAKVMLLAAAALNELPILGYDLPIFLDISQGHNRSFDWTVLEWDVFRGVNGQIPFEYSLTRAQESRIASELPFVDMESHFRSVVDDDLIVLLVRQLIQQYTRQVGSMSLVPLRWVEQIAANDVVVVETGKPFVLRTPDLRRTGVFLGAMCIGMTRDSRRRTRSRSGRRSSRV